MNETPAPPEVLRVVHVDDDEVDHLLVARCLQRAPGSVHLRHVPDLVDVAKVLLEERADVLLLDLNFSGYAGLEALEAAHALVLDVPIVVLTGQEDPLLGIAAIENGAEDYLSKDDLSSPRLWQTLRYALTRFRARTPSPATHGFPSEGPRTGPPTPRATAPDVAVSLEPGEVLERYEMMEVIGKGGMAHVYRVRHRTLGSDHALKVMLPGPMHDARRLLQEGRVQARLRHPNLVMVTDVLPIGARVGLVMEFVSGPTLDAWMHTPECQWPTWFPLFVGIVRGVRCAHAAGLIHRDLKPSNVLLQPIGDGLLAKVTDFGIAKDLDPGHPTTPPTDAGICLGTVGYMAPEQMDDISEVDARADQFALGCILYRLATGHRAYPGRSHLAVMRAVMLGQRPAADDAAPGLCPVLASIIERLLALKPDDRFADCEALLCALDDVDLERPPPTFVAQPASRPAGAAGPTVLA